MKHEITFLNPLSVKETDANDGIVRQLRQINHKLDVLIAASIPPEQLVALTQSADALKSTSDLLKSAIEHNQ